jgi:hypothetical protein
LPAAIDTHSQEPNAQLLNDFGHELNSSQLALYISINTKDGGATSKSCLGRCLDRGTAAAAALCMLRLLVGQVSGRSVEAFKHMHACINRQEFAPIGQ